MLCLEYLGYIHLTYIHFKWVSKAVDTETKFSRLFDESSQCDYVFDPPSNTKLFHFRPDRSASLVAWNHIQ